MGALYMTPGTLMGIIYQGCGALSATLVLYSAAACTVSGRVLWHRLRVKGNCCPLSVFQAMGAGHYFCIYERYGAK